MRTAKEIAAVVAGNPYPNAPTNRTVVIFLEAPPPAGFAAAVTGRVSEEIAPGRREIYVHYPDGQAHSKLNIPSARAGTARNLNTITTLAEWAAR